MNIENLKNECVLRAICAYEKDGIAIFTYKELSDFAKQDFIRQRLKILVQEDKIENNTENGFYNQYKINEIYQCPEFLFDNRLHINSKCFLLELYNILKGDYTLISTKELAKKLNSQDSNVKRKLTTIEDIYNTPWNEILEQHTSSVHRTLTNTTNTNLGTQYSSGAIADCKCTICGEDNPEMFYPGYKSVCKKCRNKKAYAKELEQKQDVNNMAKILYQRTKESFLRRNSVEEHNLTVEDIQEQLNLQNYRCYYSNLPLAYGMGKIFQPSIDRMDSSKGYIKGNICIASWAINDAKNDLSLEVFKQMIIGTYNNINNF